MSSKICLYIIATVVFYSVTVVNTATLLTFYCIKCYCSVHIDLVFYLLQTIRIHPTVWCYVHWLEGCPLIMFFLYYVMFFILIYIRFCIEEMGQRDLAIYSL